MLESAGSANGNSLVFPNIELCLLGTDSPIIQPPHSSYRPRCGQPHSTNHTTTRHPAGLDAIPGVCLGALTEFEIESTLQCDGEEYGFSVHH
jgi:hypothetical protein